MIVIPWRHAHQNPLGKALASVPPPMDADTVRSHPGDPQTSHRSGELGKLILIELLHGAGPGGPVITPGHSEVVRVTNSNVSLGARQPETAVDAVLLEVNLLEVPEPHPERIPVHGEAGQGEMLDRQVAGDGEPGGAGKKPCLLDAELVKVLAVPDFARDLSVAVLATIDQSG